jgi:hypothetical protein
MTQAEHERPESNLVECAPPLAAGAYLPSPRTDHDL